MPRLARAAIALGLVAGVAPVAAAERLRVAVLPVVVHSLEGQDYLRNGIADMMVSRLGRSPGIAVVRVEDVAQATRSLAEARASAREVGADYVLFGSFTHFGEGASLDLSCASAREGGPGKPREMFVQSDSLGEIIPKLDGLAQKVAGYLRNPAGPDPDAPVAAPVAPAVGATSGDLLDALSELETLRERLDALEQRVYEQEAARIPEVDLRQGSASFGVGSDPDPETVR